MSRNEKPTVWEVDVKEVQWVAGLLGTICFAGWFAVCLDWLVLCGVPALWLGLWVIGLVCKGNDNGKNRPKEGR